MQVMALGSKVQVTAADGTVMSWNSDELRRRVDAAATSLEEHHRARGGMAGDYFWTSRLTRSGPSVFELTAAHEPAVPALCFSSAEDTIIPQAMVEDWAAFLRAAAPGRSVRFETLSGAKAGTPTP